jgi:hypothetical protein
VPPDPFICDECIDKKNPDVGFCPKCHKLLGKTFNSCICNKKENNFGENIMAKKTDFIKFDNLEEMISSINKKSTSYRALFLTYKIKDKDILFQSFEELYSLDISGSTENNKLYLGINGYEYNDILDLDGYPLDSKNSKIDSIWDDTKHLSDFEATSNKVQEVSWNYNKYDNLPVDEYDPSLNIKNPIIKNGKKIKKKKIKEINFEIFLDKVKKIDLYDWGIIFKTESHFDAFAVFEFLDKLDKNEIIKKLQSKAFEARYKKLGTNKEED